MVYSGTLMKTIGISVMVSIGFYSFFFCRVYIVREKSNKMDRLHLI